MTDMMNPNLGDTALVSPMQENNVEALPELKWGKLVIDEVTLNEGQHIELREKIEGDRFAIKYTFNVDPKKGPMGPSFKAAILEFYQFREAFLVKAQKNNPNLTLKDIPCIFLAEVISVNASSAAATAAESSSSIPSQHKTYPWKVAVVLPQDSQILEILLRAFIRAARSANQNYGEFRKRKIDFMIDLESYLIRTLEVAEEKDQPQEP